MTGYGFASAESEALRAAVQVRSLNHRFLDLTVHLSRSLTALEKDVKALVEARLSRGRVEVSVHAVFRDPEAEVVVASRPLVAGLVRALVEIKGAHGLAGEVTVSDVARFPGALEVIEGGLDEDRRRRVLALVEQALEGLEAMRHAEGGHLGADLLRALAAIEASAARIETLLEQSKAERRQALVEKARGLCAELGLEEQRLYGEVARLVDKQDVSEEVQRLRSHVALARGMVGADGGPCGKRLDFLAQELMREANTIGSKAASAPVVHEVVGLKSEIEKLREQVQNVE
ncbi:MAG: YicC family protein [Acidobacteria bacterium]|nr:YicC family protein [Acidobacteriota bacterium]